jgi:hypothetical protein
LPIERVASELRWQFTSLQRRLAHALERLRVRMSRHFYGIPSGTWEPDVLRDQDAIVPQSLIESTVAAASRCASARGPGSQSWNGQLKGARLTATTSARASRLPRRGSQVRGRGPEIDHPPRVDATRAGR